MTVTEKEPFELLTPQQQLDHLLAVAKRTLPAWGINAGAGIKLLSLSENATYLISADDSPVKDQSGAPQPVFSTDAAVS